MKLNTRFSIIITMALMPFTPLPGQLTLTTVSDPLLGSTSKASISRNHLGETLIVAGNKIYTYTDHVTDVYTCSSCFDILDVAMVEDTMYLATNGIVRRVGDETEVVSPLRATRLIADSDGKLYGVEQFDGIIYWNGSAWQHLTTSNSGLPTNDINDIALDQNGVLWIASQIGLISWNGTAFSTKPVPGQLSSAFFDVRVDEDNNVWVASAFGGVGRYDGLNWTVFPSDFSTLQAVENLAVLHGNEIWTSDNGIGLYRYTPSNGFEAIPFQALGATDWSINRVLYGDAQNRLWIRNDFTPLMYLTTGTTGIDGPEQKPKLLSISPNPVYGEVTIAAPKETAAGIISVNVYRMDGNLIYTQTYTAEREINIQTTPWGPGIYEARIHMADGTFGRGRIMVVSEY